MPSVERAISIAKRILKIVLFITFGLLIGLVFGIRAGVLLHARETDPAPGCMTVHRPAQLKDGSFILVPLEMCGVKKQRTV